VSKIRWKKKRRTVLIPACKKRLAWIYLDQNGQILWFCYVENDISYLDFSGALIRNIISSYFIKIRWEEEEWIIRVTFTGLNRTSQDHTGAWKRADRRRKPVREITPKLPTGTWCLWMICRNCSLLSTVSYSLIHIHIRLFSASLWYRAFFPYLKCSGDPSEACKL
jgi:hypothetical protein